MGQSDERGGSREDEERATDGQRPSGRGASPGAELTPGTVVGGAYAIVRRLGTGAMGVVYVARQLSMDREVAIKVMTPYALRAGGEQVERFYREAYNASRLSHPHIVRVQDFGVDDGTGAPYLVMELLEGQTLAELLRAVGPLELDDACVILVQVARALSAAHALDIVHRDLKPENIMIRDLPGGLHATILDFGISKRLVSDRAREDSLTGQGAIVGTPRYMSPEQVTGSRLSAQTDLYALGCIFYELIEGRPPFVADETESLLVKHLRSPPPRLGRLPPGPRAAQAEDLFRRLVAKSSEARPSSADEVVRSLQALSAGSADDRFGPGDTVLRGARRLRPPTPRMRRRLLRRGVALSVMGLMALGGVLGGLRLFSRAPSLPVVVTPQTGLACPLWSVSGVPEPSGWLGAAAADVLCRRARWLLGGRPGRVHGPAELLGLPPWPDEQASLDPFAEPRLGPRSLDRAREQIGTWATGALSFEPAEARFSARMKVHDARGGERGPFEGRGDAPFEAVWAALDAAVDAGAVSPALELDPGVARAWRLSSVQAGVELEAMALRRATGLGHASACARILGGDPPPAALIHADRCPEFDAGPPDAPPEEPVALAWWTLRRLGEPSGGALDDGQAQRILAALQTRLAEVEPEDEAHHVLGAAVGSLLFHLDDPLAPAHARRLVADRPTEQLGLRASFGAYSTRRPLAQVAAQHTWHPHVLDTTRRVPREDRLRLFERAFLLGGGARSEHPEVPYKYGHALVEARRLGEARTFASRLVEGHPVHRKTAILLEAEVGLAEGELARVTRLLAGLDAYREFVPLARHLRILAKLSPELSPIALEALEALCTPPSAEQRGDFDRAMLQLELAAHFPKRLGRRCLAEFDAGRAHLAHPEFFDRCREGVARWIDGERGAAAAAWRRIRPLRWGCRVPVEAFDPVLGTRLDAALLEDRTYGGAHPAQVREARRAAARGEVQTARALAERVISAWSTADVAIPAVSRMQALLSALPTETER